MPWFVRVLCTPHTLLYFIPLYPSRFHSEEELFFQKIKALDFTKRLNLYVHYNVSYFQKGKGLGWALPGMEELQQKGTKV